MLVAVAGRLEVSDDLLGVAVEAVVRDEDGSVGEFVLEPFEEVVDAGLPALDVIQGLAVLVERVVLLQGINFMTNASFRITKWIFFDPTRIQRQTSNMFGEIEN